MAKYKNKILIIALIVFLLLIKQPIQDYIYSYRAKAESDKYFDELFAEDKNAVILTDEQAIEVFYKEQDRFNNIVNYIITNNLTMYWRITESGQGINISTYSDEPITIEDEAVLSDIQYLFEQYHIYHISGDVGNHLTSSTIPYNNVEFHYQVTEFFLYSEDPGQSERTDGFVRPIEGYRYLDFFPYGI